MKIALPNRHHEIDAEELETLVLEHQSEFHPLFERAIDVDDARVQLVDDSVEIEQVEVDEDGRSGCVSVEFMSLFYAGCKDMDSTNWHQEDLPFSIENGVLIFDIPIPVHWRVDN
ncbi:hypothetical protein [Xanthomonas campestris]|uniref:hypothetical protein n=1 Tax=Xanthomonas campestris TaxID=339 RepID=UPI003CF2D330